MFKILSKKQVYQNNADYTPWVELNDIYDSFLEAHKKIKKLQSLFYSLSHNEYSRPEYIIVKDHVNLDRSLDWYDYDSFTCKSNDGDACCECGHCYAEMERQDDEYVQSHAIGQ